MTNDTFIKGTAIVSNEQKEVYINMNDIKMVLGNEVHFKNENIMIEVDDKTIEKLLKVIRITN